MKAKNLVFSTIVTATMGMAFTNIAHAAQMEKVTLWDKNGKVGLTASKKDLKAGWVTFQASNKASSSMQHEMIVAKLTPSQIADPDSLPYNEDAAKVNEEAISDLGEVSELDPGKSGELKLDMKPGTYMLFCNVAGHYKMKMYTLIHIS